MEWSFKSLATAISGLYSAKLSPLLLHRTSGPECDNDATDNIKQTSRDSFLYRLNHLFQLLAWRMERRHLPKRSSFMKISYRGLEPEKILVNSAL
jgi:hypothetical protein